MRGESKWPIDPKITAINVVKVTLYMLKLLKRHIDDPEVPETSWENPVLEFPWSVDANEDKEDILLEYSVPRKSPEDPRRLEEMAIRNLECVAALRAMCGDKCVMVEEGEEPKFEYETEDLPPIPHRVVDKTTGEEQSVEISIPLSWGPLVLEKGSGKKYFPISVGLDIQGCHPARWREEDKQEFWEDLFGSIRELISEETLNLDGGTTE